METIDSKKAAAVWQRVRAQPEELTQLPQWIREELTDAGAYSQAAQRFPRMQTYFRSLAQLDRAQGACLKGIQLLITGQKEDFPTPRTPVEGAEEFLRRCYTRERQRLAHYAGLGQSPEWGPVFSRLAQQKQEQCGLILTMLGNLGAKSPR